MDLIGRHRRHERDEDEDWRLRRGRFADCDPDEPGRPQLRPGPRPDRVADETHNVGGNGIRQREEADDDGA